jgi:hypothetical protein
MFIIGALFASGPISVAQIRSLYTPLKAKQNTVINL